MATQIKTQDIADSAVTNAKVATGIDAAKLADGSVSNAELQRLDGVTSAIQTQIDGKAASSHTHNASDINAGALALARGGTAADLSASGGTTKVLAQDASHVVSARDLVAADIPIHAGLFLKRTILTSASGTHTTQTGCATMIVECQGAGGGGGGQGNAGGASTQATSAGGGGGGWLTKTFTGSLGATGFTYSMDATGGAGGTSGANTGTPGGDTVFNGPGGVTLTASGGAGGTGANGNSGAIINTVGGSGGSASNGDLNCPGEPGDPGVKVATTSAMGGKGGNSKYGSGGKPPTNASGAGVNGTGFGSGGSGGCALNNGASTAGGAGKPGVIIVWEFA